MTQSKEIKTINDKMKGNTSTVSRTLFKYRPFDEHTYDMLEKGYLYLCPAKKLDDPSECVVSFDVQDYIDIQTNQLTKYCVEQITIINRNGCGIGCYCSCRNEKGKETACGSNTAASQRVCDRQSVRD